MLGANLLCARSVRGVGAWLALAFVAACGPQSPTTSDVVIPFRNPTAQIGAISRFDLSAFAGTWQVRRSAGGAWLLKTFAVQGNQWTEMGAGSALITERATGRLTLAYDGGTARDLWVLWVDEGHDTVALGTPDGSFGFVAQRRGVTRTDQVRAAAQVMDFNGYRTQDWTASVLP